jgi:hypothetical protein
MATLRENGAVILRAAKIAWSPEHKGWLCDNAVYNFGDRVITAHVPPEWITKRQAKLALLGAGMLPAVEAAIAASAPDVQITWNDATVYYRNDPLIAAVAGGLGLTEDQIDDLFIAGSAIA